jgi:DNA transformation protein and related proteins
VAKSDAFARITRDVLAIVATIPRGRVTTFQSVGDCIDVPARHVAYALSRVSGNSSSVSVPIHRVVGTDGKLLVKSLDHGARLTADAVSIARDRVAHFSDVFIDAASLKGNVEASVRPAQYAKTDGDDALSALRGLGPMSLRMLVAIGVTSRKDLCARDPFALYAQIKSQHPGTSVNLIYGLIGAIENRDWREVARTEKTRILLRLDDMKLAPK